MPLRAVCSHLHTSPCGQVAPPPRGRRRCDAPRRSAPPAGRGREGGAGGEPRLLHTSSREQVHPARVDARQGVRGGGARQRPPPPHRAREPRHSRLHLDRTARCRRPVGRPPAGGAARGPGGRHEARCWRTRHPPPLPSPLLRSCSAPRTRSSPPPWSSSTTGGHRTSSGARRRTALAPLALAHARTRSRKHARTHARTQARTHARTLTTQEWLVVY